MLTTLSCNFNGTAGRRDFWMYQLTTFLLSLGGYGLVLLSAASGSGLLLTLTGLVCLAGLLFLSVAGWAVSVRRCHDLGQSGWLTLLYLVPVVSFIFFLYLGFASSRSQSTN